MHINPFLPYLPDYLSFFVYGLGTGFILKLYRQSKKGCFLGIVFYYLYAILLVFMALLVTVQSDASQVWFLIGFAFPFVGGLSLIQTGFEMLMEKRTERQQEKREQQRWAQQEQYNQARQKQSQQSFYEEQARREAEARANRAKQEQSQHHQQRQENQYSSRHNEEKRSDEQILGLSTPWTQEDLKTAYKREAGRTHPDKWVGKPEAIRQAMELEYKAIQEAYRNLKQ